MEFSISDVCTQGKRHFGNFAKRAINYTFLRGAKSPCSRWCGRCNLDWFSRWYPELIAGRTLAKSAMMECMEGLLNESVSPLEVGAFLTAMRMKGETAEELSAAAHSLRQRMRTLDCKGVAVLDTCGTGGDKSGTFNISTATAFVVAAAGCPVVKHGNRSASSKSGSADVMAALGVRIDAGPEWALRCLEQLGYAFCFAPQFHPGLRHLAPLRRRLGVRTLFNLVGPIVNPASPAYQLLGVSEPTLVRPLGEALLDLGIQRAVLVHSLDGLDEVSLSTATVAYMIEPGTKEERLWHPHDFGLSLTDADSLKVDSPEASAALIQSVLQGDRGDPRAIVLANAAAALWTAGRVASLREGVALAEAAIDSGRARQLLAEVIRLSHEPLPQ